METVEDVSAIIGRAIEVQLQLLLDGGVLDVGAILRVCNAAADGPDKPQQQRDDGRLTSTAFIHQLRARAKTCLTWQWHDVLEIGAAFAAA